MHTTMLWTLGVFSTATRWAPTRSHVGYASGNAGGRWVARHSTRINARPRTVMPIDLCVSITGRTQSSGSASADNASATFVTIRIAIVQWKAIAVRV